jgi:hypothetical protein
MSIDTQIGKIEVRRNVVSGKVALILPSGVVILFDSEDEAIALRDALTAEIERGRSET